MKTFDFNQALQHHRWEWVEWLRKYHTEPITLEQYMTAYRNMCDDDTRPYKAARYATAHLRKQYERLKSDFGFFI